MALTASFGGRSDKLQIQAPSNQCEDKEISLERTKVWKEPSPKLKLHSYGGRRPQTVPVVYYLSRNGQLQHPHFMEIPLPSSQGLFLKDVINRLNLLRGKGMANRYSWSAKRSYKNGYVWHDLEEKDFIHPVHGQEYVLKGSEILETSANSTSETASSSSPGSGKPLEFPAKSDNVEPDFQTQSRRRNQSWSAFADKTAANAFTQTDDKRCRRRQEEEEEELSREDISPPPSDSSPETLESLMKADGRVVLASSPIQNVDLDSDRTAGEMQGTGGGGKMKPSSVLMSLISCGSISLRDCGAAAMKEHGFSLTSHYKGRLPRGDNRAAEKAEIAVEDKEYFSGSLVEVRKDQILALKRSSSYNGDR